MGKQIYLTQLSFQIYSKDWSVLKENFIAPKYSLRTDEATTKLLKNGANSKGTNAPIIFRYLLFYNDPLILLSDNH